MTTIGYEIHHLCRNSGFTPMGLMVPIALILQQDKFTNNREAILNEHFQDFLFDQAQKQYQIVFQLSAWFQVKNNEHCKKDGLFENQSLVM